MIIFALNIIIFSRVTYSSISSINLASKRPTGQISTYRSQKSDLAVDGNIETWSVTGNIDVIPDNPQLAWWSVTLDRIYYVKNIILSYDSISPYREYVNNIIVYVSVDTREYLTCAYAEQVPNGLNITCKEGLYGNIVHIAKNGGTRIDILALCEVSIYGEAYRLGSNLAFKKPTSQSGTQIIYNSDLAVDGNDKTCSVAQSASEYSIPAWWQVDINGVYYVRNIIITYFPKTAYFEFLHGFIIFVSNNAEDFEQQICSTFDEAAHFYKESAIEMTCWKDIYGKFVTIMRSNSFGNLVLGLCEVYIYGEANHDTITLSYKRPTSQSGLIDSSPLAVDGNVETCSSVYVNPKNRAWWRVTLDNIYTISNINILFNPKKRGDGHMNHFNVFVSNDDDNHQQQLCTSFELGEGNISLSCKNNIAGIFITFEKYGGPNQNMMQFCEVLIYPQEFDKNCSKGSISCDSRCVPKENICDRIKHCSDGSDEINCACLPYQYKCNQWLCIHNDWLCDGTKDCPQGDDETQPSCQICSENEFKCYKNNKCIDIKKRCDGTFDCPDSSDERECIQRVQNATSSDIKNTLKATFGGEPNFFICSTYWTEALSYFACKHMGSKLHYKTTLKSLQVEKFLHVKPYAHYESLLPFMAMFYKSKKCESKKYVTLACSKISQNACGTRGKPDDRLGPYIINSDIAKLGAWPWHAQLIIKRFTGCGGSIIANDWILTAAHCLIKVRNTSELAIKVGTVVRNDQTAKSYSVDRFIVHPDFNNVTLSMDVALIKLSEPIMYSNVVRPICLPESNLRQSVLATYRYCVLSGFGWMDEATLFRYVDRLRQGRMNLMSANECMSNFLSINKERIDVIKSNIKMYEIICAGSIPTTTGVISCKGDSGSPLVCKNEHGTWTQIGITSRDVSHLYLDTRICNNNIFTKVGKYLEFIHSNMIT